MRLSVTITSSLSQMNSPGVRSHAKFTNKIGSVLYSVPIKSIDSCLSSNNLGSGNSVL